MIRKHTILVLLFLSSVFSHLIAQKTILEGVITDANSKETLLGATIQCDDKGTVSDENGYYKLELNIGINNVVFSYTGYGNVNKTITLLAGTNTLNIEMSEENTLLNTATVTSGKFEKPLSEVTVSLDVVKASLLESTNSTQVDKVLDKVPGVNMIDGQANIRGGSGYSYGAGSRVMLLVDDIPALQADAGFPNWNDIATENIEQIEVVKGAASALYGSAAMNGIINIRTGYAKLDPETHISTFGTLYLDPKNKAAKWWNTPRYSAGMTVLHKRKFEKFDLVASGFYLNEDSYNANTFDKYGRITLGGRYRIHERLSIGANVNVNKGSSSSFFYWAGNNEKLFLPDTTTMIVSDKVRFFIDPFVTYFDKKGNRHKLMGRIYAVNNKVSGDKSNQSNLYYGEYQFQRNFERFKTVLTAGVVYNGTSVAAELYGDSTFSSTNKAAYLQLDKKFGTRLNVSFGLRYEDNTIHRPYIIDNDTLSSGVDKEAKPVARLGLNYQLSTATFLRASWGQGYRFPTIAEKFIKTDAGFPIVQNPALFSETGWSTELGVKQGYKMGDLQGFLDVAIFWSQYFDMMEFNLKPGTFAFQAQNIGNTDIKGFEISAMGLGKIGNMNTAYFAGYTYIDPRFQNFTASDSIATSSRTNVLKYRFKHVAKVDMEVEVLKNFKLGGAFFYNSNMVNIDYLFGIIIKGLSDFREAHSIGSRVWDIRASYQWKHLKTTFICANIFNEEYALRPGLMDAPRNITLRLDYKF